MVHRAKRILSPGTQIAGYRIEAELGQGAMAVVYRAVQLNLDRRVALKVLSDELAANQEFVGRFFNEARAAAALAHAHIIQAYDAGVTEDNIYYFAMEYVEGETLQQRIRRQGYVRPGPGIDLAIDIADALNYGWQRQRLTHGDIKPENIMINQAEESKLADFGLAKVAGHDFDGSDIMLTPLYAAPEVIRGQHPKGDCRADIYSFGATLYHLFGGTPPFPGERAQEVMQRHLTEPLEPLRQRNAAVPRRISDLVGSLLAKDPAQRPGDWETVLASLHSIRRVLTEPPAPKVAAAAVPLKLKDVRKAKALSVRPARRRGAGAWVVVSLLLLLVVAGGLVLASRRSGGHLPWERQPLAPAAAGGAENVPAAPPATGDSAPPPATATPSTEWAELRAELAKRGDPEGALARVEEFARRHPQGLPDEYQAILAECRAAAGRSADTTPGNRGEDAQASATGPADGPPRAPVGAQGTPTALPVPGTPPVIDPGLTGPGEAPTLPARPPAPEAAASVLTDRVPVSVTPADLRADAFLGYMAQLARLEYSVPFQVESCAVAGQKLLLEFTEDCAERARTAFCVGTALPALDEVLAKLVANAEVLAGVKLPQREYSRCAVRSVTLAGLVLQEQAQHGVMLRNLAWQRVENPVGVVLHLSRVVAARSTTWRDRRPFLALLLFTRNSKLFEEAVSGLPETPEKAEWEALRDVLDRAAEDGKALRVWQKAVEACEQGERTSAYRLLTEILATRGAVMERYGQRATQLLDIVGPTVPEVAGGRLVREAAEAVTGDPMTALAKLLLASAHYGDVDFPEKSRMDRLLRSALLAMPVPEWLEQPAQRHPQHVIVAFAQPPQTGVPTFAMRAYLSASAAVENLPPKVSELMPSLEAAAFVELGDWATAGRLLPRLTDPAINPLPPAARASVFYARGLVEARYGAAAGRDVLEALRRCARDQNAGNETGQFALLPQILAVEYGIHERSGERDLQRYWVAGEALSARGPVEPMARLALGVAALALDRGAVDVLPSLLPALFGRDANAAAWGLTETDTALLRQALTGSSDPEGLALAMAGIPSRDVTEWHLRLAAAAALSRGGLNDGVWLKATEWTDLDGSTFGPVGGTAIYDLVLLRVAHLVSAGDDVRAGETLAWALEQNHPCLAPYYARLLFVHWGLLRLHGAGASRELSEQVEAAACANRAEKVLARVYVNDSLREKAREATKDSHEGRFWFDWLATCARLGRARDAGAPGERAGTARLPRAEQALAAALAGRASATAPGVP